MTTLMTKLRARDDSGFTLIEFLVAMVLFVVLMAVTMSVVVASNDAVATASQVQTLNEEARQAINRMSRDLRQANSIVTAVNPDGTPGFNPNTDIVAVRFTADYNGDGCAPSPVTATAACPVPYNASNPEDLTYCYDPTTKQLYVSDNQSGITPITSTSTSCSGGQPLLAGNVAGFTIEYRSNQYHYDANGDGVTTWRELDAAGPPVGNNNGLLDVELSSIDSLVLNLTMSVDGHLQSYRTQVDLRNRSQ